MYVIIVQMDDETNNIMHQNMSMCYCCVVNTIITLWDMVAGS